MEERPIIVGVDPGTTSAYACLDMKGNIVKLSSSKEYDLATMIREVSMIGIPAIAATDKASVPEFVRQFAVKTGARLSRTADDMLVADKRSLTRDHPTANDHERDALAAAILAFKQHRVLIRKIRRYVEIYDKDSLENKLFLLVLSKGISISLAVSILEEPEKEDVVAIKKALDEPSHNVKMLDRLHTLSEENKQLMQESFELRKMLLHEKKHNASLLAKLARKEPVHDEISKRKDNQIKQLKNMLKNHEKKYIDEENENRKLNQLMLNSKEYVMVKRISKLNEDSIQARRWLFDIQENDIILLDDAVSFSRKALEDLMRKGIIFIATNCSREIKAHFAVIDADRIDLAKTRYLAFIKKDDYERALSQIRVLERVIENYKAERLDKAST